jgi:hypothetical protein
MLIAKHTKKIFHDSMCSVCKKSHPCVACVKRATRLRERERDDEPAERERDDRAAR